MKGIKILLLPFILFIYACSSAPQKAELESSSPEVAISNIQQLKKDLIKTNTDLLAKKSFRNGDSELKKAIEASEENQSTEKVLDYLAQSKAYFLQAKEMAKTKKYIPINVLEARTHATEAQLFKLDSLKNELYKVDDLLRDNSEIFTKELSTEKLSEFQSKYQQLEIQSVQNLRLGALRNIISNAKNNKAKELAPKTLAKAENDVYYSANLITQYSRDPSSYMESVKAANKSATLLNDVMSKLKGEAKGSSEDTALKLVYQERKLGKLSNKVGSLQGSLETSESKMHMMHKDLVDKENQISNAEEKIKFQNAMNKVRNSFSEKEASVYQQGNNLIIRLKKINFKPGASSIPTNSMPLLSKINSIITELHPKEVVVEGHTDSTGNRGNNIILSNKRADAVKEYLSSLENDFQLESRGFGESKPIADNKTALGRTLNRRVDIVVKGTN